MFILLFTTTESISVIQIIDTGWANLGLKLFWFVSVGVGGEPFQWECVGPFHQLIKRHWYFKMTMG